MMQQYNNDVEILETFKNLFKKKRRPKIGAIGIYNDVLTINTSNEGTHQLFYDIFIKVKVINLFENLVEIEVIDKFVMNTTDQELQNIINRNIPKYLNPKNIKWCLDECV